VAHQVTDVSGPTCRTSGQVHHAHSRPSCLWVIPGLWSFQNFLIRDSEVTPPSPLIQTAITWQDYLLIFASRLPRAAARIRFATVRRQGKRGCENRQGIYPPLCGNVLAEGHWAGPQTRCRFPGLAARAPYSATPPDEAWPSPACLRCLAATCARGPLISQKERGKASSNSTTRKGET